MMVAIPSEHVCAECVVSCDDLINKLIRMKTELDQNVNCREFSVNFLMAATRWYAKVFASTMLALKCEYLQQRPDDQLDKFAHDLEEKTESLLHQHVAKHLAAMRDKGDEVFNTTTRTVLAVNELGEMLCDKPDDETTRRRLAIGMVACLVGILARDIKEIRDIAERSLDSRSLKNPAALTAEIAQTIVDFDRKQPF
jgi:hypothetical protein